ncbi:hypothetical protein DFH29DRAFT_1005622 [Suillus ampliporus]|nr:hypothetical protein DFH29DRAFT_1005622 [Suillus ampliporus]
MSQELGWPRDDGDLSMLIDTDVNRSVDSGFVDLTMEAPAQTSHLSTRGSQMSTHECISSTLKILRDGRISILDLLVKIMDPSQMLYSTYQDHMYVPLATEKQLGNGRLEKVLDFLWDDPQSHVCVLEWMQPHALSYVCDTMYGEMDQVKQCLHVTLNTITPKLLLACNVETTLSSVVHEHAPVLCKIIASTAQTECAKVKNKVKDCGIVRPPQPVPAVIMLSWPFNMARIASS